MNRILTVYINLLLLILILLPGCKSSNSEMYQDESGYAADSTQVESSYNFESDTVSVSYLHAFETRALQKLHDVTDLVQILANDTTEQSFRLQAKTMMIENFGNQENTIVLPLPDSKTLRLTISQFADSLLANQYSRLKLKITKSGIKDALAVSTENEDEYTGTIFFVLNISQDNKTLYPKDMTVQIQLKKKQKDFGGTTREVWEVFLGDINL